jgi:pantoate kinase
MISAFAPCNISCIFVIKKGTKATNTGSLGLGFTVNKGVFATVKKINNNKKYNNQIQLNKIIYFNNKKINLPTIDSVIQKLTKEKVVVRIKSELPLGYGFGVSGASALATAYALNKLLRLNKTKKNLAMIAHIAEVENGTGLGDVTNQYYGGFLIKYGSSCKFKVKKLLIKNKKLYYKYFSSINTKKIISGNKNKINRAGIKALSRIKRLKNKNLKDLIQISKEFSVDSGLLKNKIKKVINQIENKGGNASMIMLGNAVFSDTKFKGSKVLVIKDKGAYLC